MFPWFWLHWAPQLHFPLSGAVTQDLDFFGRIRAQAGDGDVERAVFDVASYGRQLGWLVEAALGQAPAASPAQAAAGRAALVRLQALADEVEAIKTREQDARDAALGEAIERLAQREPARWAALLARHAPPPAVVATPPAARPRQAGRGRRKLAE